VNDRPALAQAAAAGDHAALDALLTDIRSDVLRICARFLPHREDAEEACQDTLLAVANGVANFRGQSAFDTWLYRIAANRSRTTYRSLLRRSTVDVPLVEPADPRTTSVMAGTRLDLLEALDAIGPELAEPVTLRDVIGLDYREIALTLGLPEGTVKSRIHEARRRLRLHMAERP
jgi:RNA polymerase sigma factor (sigma-70 family)